MTTALAERSLPAIGSTVASKYVIESMLGRGGMGAVFAARHVLTDRRVALKWMLPDLGTEQSTLRRFLREARAMGRIDHPSVVAVLDVGTEGDATFIVMERLRGSSLRDLLDVEGAMEPERVVALMLPALDGVAAAHRSGVIHRDLKPENLFVVSEGDGAALTTKVLDFGISKLREEGEHAISLTRTGTPVGTPNYMSPEQVRAAAEIDGRADVWALGVILYELLSGRIPFRADTYGAVSAAILNDVPTPLHVLDPSVSPGLSAVVASALEKDVDARCPSVDDLARQLLAEVRPTRSARSRVPPSAAQPTPVTIPGRRLPSLALAEVELELDWRGEGESGRTSKPFVAPSALPRPAPLPGMMSPRDSRPSSRPAPPARGAMLSSRPPVAMPVPRASTTVVVLLVAILAGGAAALVYGQLRSAEPDVSSTARPPTSQRVP